MTVASEIASPGEVLLETYRVERVIGGGGMGIVLAATSIKRGDRVAIKILQPDQAVRGEIVGRFLLEANAVLKIQNPHVAHVFDVGRLPNGAPYMVMEYLEGSALSTLLRERGRLPVPVAVDYVLQACEAVVEAHMAGIVHRDLKPANLFVVQQGGGDCVKVLDFGVSKMRSETGASLGRTAPYQMLGSPFYMAPEQIQSSRDVDQRCDIWALGVTLYELCTGKRPFQGEALPTLMMAVMQREPVPLRELLPDAPPELAEVVARCLQKDPAQRYPNVALLAEALAPLAPERALESIERISRVSRATPMPSAPPDAPEVAPKPPARRGRAGWVLLALAIVAVVVAAAVLHFRR